MTEKSEKILIVDDEDSVRTLMHRKLSREGYECEEAGNADEALEKLKANSIGLVFLDIHMPGRSGIDLLTDVRSLYPDTAVIMATATSDISIAIQCMRQGAYDYINKPFNIDEMVLHAGRALENRRIKLENRDYQQHLEQKVDEQSKKIRDSFLNATTALANALEAKDKYTSGHSQRVSEISVAIAKELGLPQDTIDKIRLAGQLHDIGKIGVAESVLNSPTRLSDNDFNHIKRHCEIGEYILTPIISDQETLDIIRHHHERYDGSGYPDGLSGKQMSLGARIMAVSDAYDAMTSERPYRAAMGAESARVELERCRGSQFDPEVVDAFLRIRGKVAVDIK